MAIDPQQLAVEQTQRTAMDTAGAPTEFAPGPEQMVQVAGGSGLSELLRTLGRAVKQTNVPRPPTPQERRLVDPRFSERAAREQLAPQVLSPEGVQTFQQRGLEAPTPGAPGAPGIPQPAQQDVLQSATEALDQQAVDAATQADTLRKDAGKALTAQQRGFGPESGVISEEIADPVLTALEQRDLQIKSLKEGGDFNFDYITSPDDVKATITAVGETLSSQQAAVTRGVVSNETTLDEAAKIAADEVGLTRQLLNRKTSDGTLTAAQMVAARDLLVKSAKRVADLAEKIRIGNATAVDRLAFRRQLAIHAGIQLQVKGFQTEAARALQSFRIPVAGELSASRMGEEAVRALRDSGDDATDTLAATVLNSANLPGDQRMAAINKLAEKGWAAKTMEAVGEAYMIGLLSSPATQAKNILGTASFMAWQLPEEIIAGAWGSVVRGVKGKNAPYTLREDQVQISDAMFRMKGWVDSIGDAFRIASIAWRTEVPTEQMTKIDYTTGAIRWPGQERNSFFARSIDAMGKVARIPFRFLLAGDEFFKTVSQRGELYVAANRRYHAGIRNGMDNQAALDEAGMVLLDPRAVSEDVEYKARYDTMTLDTGLIGDLARRVQNIPVLGRIVLPFSTAPTNDMLRTLERLPIPIGSRRLIDDMLGNNGPKAQQLATGRWALGSATFVYTAKLAAEGRLTGSTPDDPKVREALPPGWQPYSVVLRGAGFPRDADGDYLPLYDEYGRPNGPLNYVNYAGYGPVSSVIGLGATIPQSIAMSRDPEQSKFAVTAAVGAVAEYYKELPMLQGVAQLIDFTEGFDVENIMRSPASAATPIGVPNIASSLQRGYMRAKDPTRVTPRDDVEYYTMADADAGYLAEDPMFTNPDGSQSYRLVGTPKGDMGTQFREVYTMWRAYQQQDSFFADERDLNAVKYDTLGNAIGASDVSFASAPNLAIWNMTTGLVIKQGRELNLVEQEMIRLAKNLGGWPITNPTSIGGIKLSAGVQSDLIAAAKNDTIIPPNPFGSSKINPLGSGPKDFRSALEDLIFFPEYVTGDDIYKRQLIRNLNKQYIDAGFNTLLQMPEYANLRQAYEDVQSFKEQDQR